MLPTFQTQEILHLQKQCFFVVVVCGFFFFFFAFLAKSDQAALGWACIPTLGWKGSSFCPFRMAPLYSSSSPWATPIGIEVCGRHLRRLKYNRYLGAKLIRKCIYTAQEELKQRDAGKSTGSLGKSSSGLVLGPKYSEAPDPTGGGAWGARLCREGRCHWSVGIDLPQPYPGWILGPGGE